MQKPLVEIELRVWHYKRILLLLHTHQCNININRSISSTVLLHCRFLHLKSRIKQAVGGRPPRYAPPLSSPPPWAPKCFAPSSRRQRISSFLRPTRSNVHRCSRLTRQHGGEQSGLVTLTFDLLTLEVVSELRVTWATSLPILVFHRPLYSRLRPDVRDRRQIALSLYAPAPNRRGIKRWCYLTSVAYIGPNNN